MPHRPPRRIEREASVDDELVTFVARQLRDWVPDDAFDSVDGEDEGDWLNRLEEALRKELVLWFRADTAEQKSDAVPGPGKKKQQKKETADPLRYWESAGCPGKLPLLRAAAPRILCARLSASARERAWSAFARLITPGRSRFTISNAAKIVTIQWA